MATGWTMPSRREAEPAMTIRRWASPRGVPGNLSNGFSVIWTSIPRLSRSRWWASVICRVTFSAMACCYPDTSDSSVPSTICIFSLIPIPIQPLLMQNVNACSRCRGRRGKTTIQISSLKAAVCGLVTSNRSTCPRPRRRRLASAPRL